MPPTPRLAPRVQRGTLIALVALSACAALLRLHALDRESLWLDEAFSVLMGRSDVNTLLRDTADDFHPPLHFLLLNAWFHVVEGSAWSARFLSLVCSVATMSAAFAAARALANARTGVVAAGLLAVSVFQVEYAQEARMYALLALLSTLSTVALTRLAARPAAGVGEAVSHDNGPLVNRAWLAYVLWTSLLVYTHVHSAFLIAAHAAIVATTWGLQPGARRFAERWFTAMLAVTLAFLPWAPTLYLQFTVVQRGFWIPAPANVDLVSPLVAYAGSAPLAWLLVALAAWGFLSLGRDQQAEASWTSPRLVLALWLAFPIVLPFAVSLVGSPVFLPKYTIAASVPFAILAAAGVTALPRLVGAGLVAWVLVWSVQPLQTYFRETRKDDWRQAVHDLEHAAAPGDAVMFYPFFTEIPWAAYQSRHDIANAPLAKHAAQTTEPTLRVMFDQMIAERSGVWLIVMEYDARKPLLESRLRQRFTTVTRRRYGHIELYESR